MKLRHLLLLGTFAAAPALGQIESGDRGIPVLATSSSIEVGGVHVDVAAPNASEARSRGWREAQRGGWEKLWAQTTGRPVAEAPKLPDGTLDSIAAGIIVEREQIGPTRYIADLGVLFDRARVGALLGVGGGAQARSAPMLVIPVMIAGGTATSVELRNPWQAAWARFRTAGSPIDYVRVQGTGVDPLLVNAAQTHRPGRAWWRLLIDLYGTSDVLVPEVQLVRAWPGGPVTAHFTARHGPDREVIDRFTLRVGDGRALPKLMDSGVQRIDAAYARALGAGALSPDPTLTLPEPEILEPLEEVQQTTSAVRDRATRGETAPTSVRADTPFRSVTLTVLADAGAAQAAVRGIPGVGAVTVLTGNEGVTTLRVIYAGDPETLRSAVRARGVRLGGGAPSPAPPPPPPPVAAPAPPPPAPRPRVEEDDD